MFNLLFRFKGEIGRGQFWLGACIAFMIAIGSMLFTGKLVGDATVDGAPITGEIALQILPVMIPLVIGMFASIPMIAAISTKRLRNRNKGPIWLFCTIGWMLLPVLAILFPLVPLLSCLWVVIELGCLGSPQSSGSVQQHKTALAGSSQWSGETRSNFGTRSS